MLGSGAAFAEPPPAAAARASSSAKAAGAESPAWLRARSESYLRLFQRAPLPGGSGALVETRTLAPIHEFISVGAYQVSAPWGGGALDAEVSAWGAVVWGEEPPRRLDADLTTAFVHQRLGPGYVRLGRQMLSSAAAQLVRFDGARAGAALTPALAVDVYAGFTVLPRWNERLGYQHLGAAREALAREPRELDGLDRAGSWLAGGRLALASEGLGSAALSLHEERQSDDLARRNLGLEAKLDVSSDWSVASSSTLTADGLDLVDARLWLDVTPSASWSLTGEYLRADPSLYLSRQSVLSVFGTSRFDELGGTAEWRPLRRVALSGSAFAQVTAGETGMRSQARVVATPDRAERVRLQLVHARLLAADNGYHSLRASLAWTLSARLVGRADAFVYRYDEPIKGARRSLVQVANLTYRAGPRTQVLCGVSHVQSPYARSDFQGIVRLTHELEAR